MSHQAKVVPMSMRPQAWVRTAWRTGAWESWRSSRRVVTENTTAGMILDALLVGSTMYAARIQKTS
jgi:hypothetical protein